MKAEKHPEA